MKKRNPGSRDIIYIHLNEQEQYVLTSGIEFTEFAGVFSSSLNYLLLLKHSFDQVDFNLHTLHEYVTKENLYKLMKDDVYSYGDFCWIDFEEEEMLDELPGQVIAELLYLGHLKEHLRPPFYNCLSNQYVYLAHEDGWFNKTYYRNLRDFYRMLGEVIPGKMGDIKAEKSLLRIKKRRTYPSISIDAILSLKTLMKEGVIFSIRDSKQSRTSIEIPIWVIGDFANIDDMYDEYKNIRRKPSEVNLVFDKKQGEWRIIGQ